MKITLKDTKTGQILKLTKVDEYTYYDEISGYQLVDTDGEIQLMVELFHKQKSKNFWDCHIFLDLPVGLQFFPEVDLISIKKICK